MSAKHTPGPWAIGDLECRGLGSYAQILSDGQFADIVARVCVEHKANFDLNKCGQANARLIAAAPELLEALKHCEDLLNRYEINRIDGDAIGDAALFKIRAVIAKATGSAA